MAAELAVFLKRINGFTERDSKSDFKGRAGPRIATFVVDKDGIGHADFLKVVVSESERNELPILRRERGPLVGAGVMMGRIDIHAEPPKSVCELLHLPFEAATAAEHN
jgi:hypothetical protein